MKQWYALYVSLYSYGEEIALLKRNEYKNQFAYTHYKW